MNTTEIILALLSSTVIAALISAFVSILTHNKSNKLKYVTEERQRWREELRAAAVELRRIGNADKAKEKKEDKEQDKEKGRVCASDIRFETVAEAKTFFQVRLNPYDDEDNELLKLIVKQEGEQEEKISDENLNYLSKAISYLLKHDWERVKQETSTGKLIGICKLILVLVISSLVCMLLCPSVIYTTVQAFEEGATYVIDTMSVLCIIILLLLLLTARLVWIGFKPVWQKCKKWISTSDDCVVQYIGEVLNIPHRESIKKQEKKNGKND